MNIARYLLLSCLEEAWHKRIFEFDSQTDEDVFVFLEYSEENSVVACGYQRKGLQHSWRQVFFEKLEKNDSNSNKFIHELVLYSSVKPLESLRFVEVETNLAVVGDLDEVELEQEHREEQ